MYKSFFNLNILKNWVPACAGMTILFLIPVVSAQNLFQESYNFQSIDEQQEFYTDPLVIRNRIATLDKSQLFSSAVKNQSINLNLFADVELKAQVKNGRSLSTGASFISGSLEGGGHITLFISKEGIVRGEVHSPKGVYTIKSSKDQVKGQDVIIRQIDKSNTPQCGNSKLRSVDDDDTLHLEHNSHLDSPEKPSSGLSVYKSFQNTESSLEEETPDETVDVLVVYTNGAEANEGGKKEVEATIEAEIEKTNQAFINSGLSHRKIRLVAMEKADYIGEAMNVGAITKRAGRAHKMRVKYAADMIHLFVEKSSGGVCGRGGLYSLSLERQVEDNCNSDSNFDECMMQQRRQLWRYNSQSVSGISDICRLGYAFQHELGHNFGLFHSRYESRNLRLSESDGRIVFPMTPYGFGYMNQNLSSQFKCTIMSKSGLCFGDESSHYVLSAPMFSNPDLDINTEGDAAGVAGEEWTTDLDGPVNASRQIDEVWDIVANLYHSSTSCSNMLFSNVPESVRISSSGGTKRYTLSSSSVDADYCSDENVNLTVSSNDSFITASVETRTVTNDEGDESYEYDVTITVNEANNSCNARTGSVNFSGDNISKEITISQTGQGGPICELISEVSDTDAGSIVSLDFSGENLNQIGGLLFTQLTGLESLNLSNNNIKNLPANAFTQAETLEDLNDENLSRKHQIHLISNNQSITGLINLKTLNLSGNLISKISNLAFSHMFNLQALNLSNNRLRTLPKDLFSDLVELEELNLSNNQIRALPATVFNNLSELEELDLSDNQIANLPTDVFSKNTSLEYLWLHNNNIPRITANAFNTLTNLKALSLDGNAVRALSANAFSKTTELEYLWLSADETTKISGNTFSKPTKLKYLNLSVNKLTELPAILFSKLTNLRYLSLSVNGVTTLPSNMFSKLSNVRYLRLSGDGITRLPSQVCTFINNVRYVRVSGFDLETVCPSSAAGVSVTNFFQRMIDRGSDWVSGATGMTTGTGVTTSNANTGFASYNENVITKLYEDNIKPSEISRLTGYDENIISQTIQSQPLLQ